MKNCTHKRKEKGNNITIHLENPRGGISFEKLSTTLSWLLSEKDILEYLSREDDLFHISTKEKISTNA